MPFPRRIVLAGLAFALLTASNAFATDYYADVNGGPWTSASTWHLLSNTGPPAASFPGAAPGDKAIIDFQGITVTLTASLPNPVTLNASNVSCFVNVNAGGVLPLTGNSFVGGGTVLILNGGTITNAGLLEIAPNSGFTFNSGTLNGGGITQIDYDPTLPALLSIVGGSISQQTLNIAGKASYTGTWAVNNSAQVNIGVNGSFDVKSLGPITTNTPATADINNSGTFKKTAGAGGTNIDVPVNNSSLVDVTTGVLVLGGSPVHTNGTFNIATNCAIEFHGTFQGTNNVTGAGNANIVGTPVIDNGATVNFTNIAMNGGWLQGPAAGTGTANISGTVTFNGGVWRQNILVNLLGTSTTNIVGVASAFISDNARVDNDGTFNVNAGTGPMGINNGAYINNNTTINLIGDVTINSDSFNNARIENRSGASILKTSGAGIAFIKVILNNSGTVQSNSGSMQFAKSGVHTGTFKICDACTFDFAAGSHTLDGASIEYINVLGNPIAKLSGATFDIPTSAQISTNFQFLHTAGTITGAGSLSIFAAYIWGGGTQSGSGDTQLSSYAHVFNGGNSAMVVNGRDIQVSGTLTYAPVSTNYLAINSGATLTNAGGNITLTTDAPINGDGTGTISNELGTVHKNGGSGKAVINAIFNSFNPIIVIGKRPVTHSALSATLNITSGQVALNAGGFNDGNIFVPNAANAVVFEAGTYSLNSGTTTNPADLGVFRVAGGTLQIGAAMSLKNVELLSGVLTGSDLTITNKLAWKGGTNLGPGNTTIANTAALSHLAPALPTFLDNRALHVDGTADYEGNGLTLRNNAVINNNAAATFNLRDGAILNGAGSNFFNNFGMLKKNAGSSGMRFDVAVKNNGGTISSEVSGQSLIFANGGTQTSGTLTTTSSALIDFFSGTFAVNGGTLSGTGQMRVNGGTLQVNANLGLPAISLGITSGSVDIASSITFQVNSLFFSGGTINGPGTLRTFGGSIGNIAPTALANDATLTIPSATFNYNTDMVNYLTINDTSNLNVESGGIVSMIGDGKIAGPATASFSVSGTFKKTVGAGTAEISIPVSVTTGSPLFGATSGTLVLTGGGSIIAGAVETGTNATVAFSTGSFALSASINGAGTIAVQSGTLTIFTGTISIPNLSFTGGTINSSSGVTIGTGTWSGGDFTGGGDWFINTSLTITGAGTKNFNGVIHNNGTIAVDGANIGGGGLLHNHGTFNRNIADSLTFAVAVDNNANATANFNAGSITFNGYTQNAGTTNLAGGSFSAPSVINFNGGLLKGNGTIGGSVANNGATVAPGASPGIITIGGNYTQSPTGVLNIELGGTAPGTQYDRLAVTGSANLAGTVNVSLINGFTLSSGDVFDVVTYASHSGAFTTENLPPFPGGTFTSTYTPSAYQLVAAVPSPADLAVTKNGPTASRTGAFITYTIKVKNLGGTSAAGVIVNDPTPQGLTFVQNTGDCTTPFPCPLGTLAPNDERTIVARYQVASNAGASVTNTAVLNVTDPNNSNNSASATTVISCPNSAVTNLSPTGTAGTSGTFTWDPTAAQVYEVFFGPKGNGCTTSFAKTLTNSLNYSGLQPDTEYEWRVESSFESCPVKSSDCVTFKTNACSTPEAPLARVVGEATSAKSYAVEWDVLPGAARYEVDEAKDPSFADAVTTVVNQGTSITFVHDAAEPTAYHYRVRARGDCQNTPGPYSIPIRVVIVPPPSPDDPHPTFNLPFGSDETINHKVFIPGQLNQTLFFRARTDREWLRVSPETGPLPPQGVLLDVIIEPEELPNGTFTATVIVDIDSVATGRLTPHGSTTSIPISVNLVTPVSPVPSKSGPSQYSLIIPAVGHLPGVNSAWQSDVRLSNAGFRAYKYRLIFTPASGTTSGVRQTDLTVAAGATTALDDIIRNWFGQGSLKDGESGSLEIVPLEEPANASLVTVAASRTYNVTANGTLGQFVPAVPFPSFIGRAASGALPTILSLQQIAQSNAFRTNVGIVEGGGKTANAVISVFNATGAKLLDLPQTLAAGQQLQLNALLAQNNITLTDGRIEVRVTGGDGKVTAYASMIDNSTGDPLLVSGVPLTQTGTSKYVLPGVANTNTGFADWRTDMRIFNYGTVPQTATLTFFPLGGGASQSAEVFAQVGEVLALDNVVKTLFGADNLGGIVHVTTPQPASFIVSGRTYNQTAAGTLGQFIPAVTVNQAVGVGGRALQILQVEDSPRFRMNVGVAEVSGKPATVEIQVVIPDSKITPVVQVPLAANEVRQLNVIRELDLGNVYNGRISVRVISGEGRVTAFGSLIDELTGDPAFIQGQ